MTLSRRISWFTLPVALWACGGSTSEPNDPARERTGAFEPMMPAARLQTDQEMNEQRAARRAAAGALDERQIASVTQTAHSARIEEAKLAYPKIQDDRVLEFAQKMLAVYGKAQRDEQALYERLGIEPEFVALSGAIEEQSGKLRYTLREAGGGPVDRTYMEAQIAALQEFSTVIERRLLPGAAKQELRSWLGSLHERVNDHLEEAREISEELEDETETQGSVPASGMGAP